MTRGPCTAQTTLRRRWIIAVTLAQFTGLLAPVIVDGWTTHAVPAVVAISVAFAGAAGGVVLAVVQAMMLRSVMSRLRIRDWVAATLAGVVIAWAAALIPMMHGATIAPWPASAQTAVVTAIGIVVIFAVLRSGRCCDGSVIAPCCGLWRTPWGGSSG